MLRLILLSILLFFATFYINCQQSISGVVNSYYKVTSLAASSVTCSGTAGLQPGDKVVLMQMTGISYSSTPDVTDGNLTPINPLADNIGKFEMLAVKNVAGNVVEFTVNINASFTSTEKIQLIKIFEADYASVDATLTASDWDGNTGGVLALVIFKKLTLNADIDVSKKGFRGANTEFSSTGICRPEYSPDTFYFPASRMGITGTKGEGNVVSAWAYPKGPGRIGNAGGGGLGRYAGGGGGSHFGQGGSGGSQVDSCPYLNKLASPLFAQGGPAYNRLNYYKVLTRVMMGGGGGSSVEDGSYTASKGGDGGGIVILLTDTLAGNGHIIKGDGEAVAVSASAGGGGGGGGGAILLDVNTYSAALTINAKGGKGGSTTTGNTGAGGGGGGGVFWFSGSSIPGSVTYNMSPGAKGGSLVDLHSGGGGSSGDTLKKLKLPLNGFLFNSVNATDTICAGQQPKLFTASAPKGGQSSYTYKWLQSTDSITWDSAYGPPGSLTFQADPLYQTTWFTRVVGSGIIKDTALPEKVHVYNAISGNILTNRDTICFGTSPGTLTGGTISGGRAGVYEYNWESSPDQSDWTEQATTPSFNEGNLYNTTYYRRIVTSAVVCVDTSNIDTLIVLELIGNNSFLRPDTAICKGSDGGTIRAGYPTGGYNSYYFEWQKSNVSMMFSTIGGAESQNYNPGIQTEDQYYRRIVYSGLDSACSSISDTFTITVYLNINNNNILGGSLQYICYNTSEQLTGSTPGGGKPLTSPEYRWEQSEDNTIWQNADGNYEDKDYIIPGLTDTFYYHRIVLSGENHQCIDTSVAVFFRINQLPEGFIVSKNDTVCAGSELEVTYNLTGNGPWSISLGDQNSLFEQDNISSASGTVSFPVYESAVIRILELSDDSTCVAEIDSGVVNAVVYTIPIADAGPDDEVCGLIYTLSALPSVGSGLWKGGDATFDDSTSNSAIVTSELYKIQTFIWTETNWQCYNSDEVLITFFEQPESANAGEDQSLNYLFQTALDAEIPLVGEGHWSIASENATIQDISLTNSNVEFSAVGDYIFKWTVINGVCIEKSDTVIIKINDLKVFTGFSPNGDGVNDKFILELSRRYKAKLLIFDGWGGLVYEKSGEDEITWDGTNIKNNKPVPEGTYYYILEEPGNVRKGYIELRR